jgi:methionine-gamma-lyase
MCKNFGVEASFVDTTDICMYTYIHTYTLQQIKKAIKPNTNLIYLESPANPTMAIADIPAICKLAKEHAIIV